VAFALGVCFLDLVYTMLEERSQLVEYKLGEGTQVNANRNGLHFLSPSNYEPKTVTTSSRL